MRWELLISTRSGRKLTITSICASSMPPAFGSDCTCAGQLE